MPASIDLSCVDFVEVLASKEPAPGGGGAAALAGAIGAALGNMVGSLTAGKPKYADVEGDIRLLNDRAQALQARLLTLVDADADAFRPLAEAYRMPAGPAKDHAMATCLDACCAVPLEIMRACCEAIELCEQYAAKGSRLAVSDAGCGAAICRGALQAASLNVYANTRSMTNRERATELEQECENMLESHLAKADRVFAAVEDELRS